MYHYALEDPILSGMSCVRIAGAFIRQLVEECEKLKSEKEELKDVAYRRECEVFTAKADAVRKIKSELYEEFLKVVRCQISSGPNMQSQEVFAILERITKKNLEDKL